MPKIIAHRGFAGRAPENTMAAFETAVDFGVDGLECDVHLSKDGEIVVCHDEAVDRTTNGTGLIKDLAWSELAGLDAGSWFGEAFKGEKLPTLRQLAELVQGSNLLFNIELKTNVFEYPGIEQKVVDLLKELDLIEQSIISSFQHYSLTRVKAICPELKTGILYGTGLYEPWNYARSAGADALHPLHSTLNEEIVRQTQQNGVVINAWTIDKPEHIKQMLALNVDGIITNYPDRVKELQK